MKIIAAILSLNIFFTIISFAQEEKTVTLTVSGQGKTQEEAKQNALRSAIEQAFGTFISSNTEILNDELVKDEIVSVSNGNIQKFEVISEVQIPDGRYATTLKATVSVTKLTSFVESKGVVAEFKGNLFAFNIKQQILNEQAENLAMENMVSICSRLLANSFDYQIDVLNPISEDQDNQKWIIPINIKVKTNQNIEILKTFITKTLLQIALSEQEKINYKTLGKETYSIKFYDNHSFIECFLRTQKSQEYFNNLIDLWNISIFNFEITNGFKFINGNELKTFSKNDKYRNKNLIYAKVNQNEYLEFFSDRSSGRGYGWYDLIVNPAKINSQSLKLKEEQILAILQVTNYSYQGTFGTEEFYSFIFPNSGTVIGNLKYSDYLTIEEINKISEYKITNKNLIN